MKRSSCLCFGFSHPISDELCASFTGQTAEDVRKICKATGYNPYCSQCELVKHGAMLSHYQSHSAALKIFEQNPHLLEELYRNAHRYYLVSCPRCFQVYKVFLENILEGQQEEVRCLHCQTPLPSVGSYQFEPESLPGQKK